VDFDKNSLKIFYFLRENWEITFKEYFKKQYNVDINNMNQPLLVSLPSRCDRNRGDNEPIFLIALEGKIVMCTYNSNTYKIDEVDFDKNPLKIFDFLRENREITFKESRQVFFM